jgi:hypothetical protein
MRLAVVVVAASDALPIFRRERPLDAEHLGDALVRLDELAHLQHTYHATPSVRSVRTEWRGRVRALCEPWLRTSACTHARNSRCSRLSASTRSASYLQCNAANGKRALSAMGERALCEPWRRT